MSVFALIPAAGSGRRFGSPKKKQYLELFGQPILAHTLRLFNRSSLVDAIFLIAPSDELQFCRQELVRRYAFHKVVDVICGGEERQNSVYNGLMACGARPKDIILVHDGVRPFLTETLLADIIYKAEDAGACLAAIPVRDTLKEVVNGWVSRTPERKKFWQAQTPQAFRYDIVLPAYQKAFEESYLGTDDASLVERYGVPVAVVEGSCFNIKITTPEDLKIADGLRFLLQE